MTLVFPESSAVNSAPSQQFLTHNVSAEILPSSASSFSTLSPDTSLAFSIPYAEAAAFLEAMKEIPAPEDVTQVEGSDKGTLEEKKWMMRASRNGNASSGIRNWVVESLSLIHI